MKRSVLVVLGLFAAVGVARASQFEAFDRESQVRASDAVVVGRVVGTDSYWTPDRAVILTDAVVEVEETWKGSLPDRIVVQTLGGTVDHIFLHVDGAATFAAGERVVLFLEQTSGRWVPAGMRFGKLDVRGAAADAFAVGLLPPAVPGSGELDVVSISLGDLRDEVRAITGSVR